MDFIVFILMKPMMNLITFPDLNNFLGKILDVKLK